MAELRDLVPREFKDSLSEAEKLILENAPKGEWADCREIDGKDCDVEKPEEWPESRTVRAKFLEWLLRDKNAQMLIHDKGVRINGIRIADQLDLACIRLHFPVGISYSRFECRLTLYDANVQEIDLQRSFIAGMHADLMVMEGSLFLRNIMSIGEIRLVGANIDGYLDSRNATFKNEDGTALNCESVIVKNDIFLRNNEIRGRVNLMDANVGRSLYCDGTKFVNKEGESFNSDRITTKGTIFLDGIESTGEFRLVRANIGGNLSCTGAKFKNEKGDAFSGDGIATKGDIFLRGIESKGEFRLLGTNIGADLYCRGASFQNREETALRMTQAVIDGRLCVNKVEKVEGKIDLSNTKAGAFVDDENSWPDKGNLLLDGFEYGSFADDTPTDIDTRLKWLKRQPQRKYLPQPYQQLAKVYRKMGRDRDAKKVLLEKERMRRKFGKLILPAKIWSYFLDLTIGYGYQIGKALGIVLFLIVYGSVFFHWAYNGKLMQELTAEKKADLNIEFSPFVYSVDVLVPFLDLNQEKYWRPDPTVPAKSNFLGYRRGWWAQTYLIIHIILGWVFTTLLAASLTGLIRRE